MSGDNFETSSKHSDKSAPKSTKGGETGKEEEKDVMSAFEGSAGEASTIKGEETALVNFGALDQYLYVVVQNMVDDVCLYDAKK